MGANQRAAPPGMLILVCRPRSQPRRAARYAYFGLPPARLRVRRAARYAYFGPAAPPGGARKHPGSWLLITPAACRKA